jgi:hypothetical protein
VITPDELESLGLKFDHSSMLAEVYTGGLGIKAFAHPGGHLLEPEELHEDGSYDDVMIDSDYYYTADSLAKRLVRY